LEGARRKVLKGATIIGGATLLSRVLGYLRDMVVAHAFGANWVTDAFYVAFRIPSLLRELFAEGSLSAAFIPVFTEYLKTRTPDEARRLARAAFSLLLVILCCTTLIGVLAAPALVAVIAPGFFHAPEQFDLTIRLTQIMFPYLLFISLAALAMGILNALQAFAAPALAPVMLSLGIIGSVFFICPSLETPIYGLALGVVIGGAGQFLFQVPALFRREMEPGWRWEPAHAGLKRMGQLLLPVLGGLSVTQVNIFINTLLASFLAVGSVTYLYYGMRLIQLPLGVFGVGMAMAILPTLSAQAVERNLEALRSTLAFGLRCILLITVPAMVGLILLRVPIIHLLFEHGAFTRADTLGTAWALLFYAVGLWAYAGVRVVVQAYYSLQDTRTPMWAAALAVGVNIAASLLLMGPLAHGGLALATALAAMVNFLLLLGLLRRRLGRLEGRRLVKSLGQIVFASAAMGVAVWGVIHLPLWQSTGALGMKILLLGGTIGLGVIVYAVCLQILRNEEWQYLFGIAKEKLVRIYASSP
jgi:putative peptidoglycan lipid II flippase